MVLPEEAGRTEGVITGLLETIIQFGLLELRDAIVIVLAFQRGGSQHPVLVAGAEVPRACFPV